MLKDTELKEFTRKISSLPDEPALSPQELKARFDACPEELRGKHNELVGGLLAEEAAAEIGFARSAAVPEDTVQRAVENVQQQLRGIALGAVPAGSIGRGMLTGALAEELDGVQETLAQHSTQQEKLQTEISKKCEIHAGTYKGDDEAEQTIALGFTPAAVLVFDVQGRVATGSRLTGGLATGLQGPKGIEIIPNGFKVRQNSNQDIYLNAVHTNYSPYSYICFA